MIPRFAWVIGEEAARIHVKQGVISARLDHARRCFLKMSSMIFLATCFCEAKNR
jgi:hypothetical protein